MDIPVKKTDLDEATVLAERLKLEKIAQVTTQKQNDILAHRVKELQDQVERLNRELDSAYVMVDISDNDADWGPVEYIGYPIHMNSGQATRSASASIVTKSCSNRSSQTLATNPGVLRWTPSPISR